MIRNMALAPWVTPGRWPLGGWSPASAPNLRWKSITGNLILEFAALALLLLHGMRRGEVLGLRWQDVDLDTGLLRVRQQIGR
jgi:integrase